MGFQKKDMFRRSPFTLLAALLLIPALFPSCSRKERLGTPEEILSTMSVREKVSQIIISATFASSDPEYTSLMDTLMAEGIGGIIWMDAPVGDLVEETNALSRKVRIPLLVTVDAEWGLSMRCPDYVKFPKQGVFGKAEGMEDILYEMGVAVGKDLCDLKIHANFAPVVDINTNPHVQILGLRSFGSDRDRVTSYALSYMHGMQDGGILTCAKHFPGHGEAAVDSHVGLPYLDLSRERLDSVELYPYRKLIGEGVDMVMVAHLSVPALDSTLTPTSISKPVITGLLREELGFEGCIITDALEMKGLTTGRDPVQVAKDAFLAGADILLMPSSPIPTIDLLEKSVLSGEIPESALDEKVLRVLKVKKKAGLLDEGYSPVVRNLSRKVRAAHRRDTVLMEKILSVLPEDNGK